MAGRAVRAEHHAQDLFQRARKHGWRSDALEAAIRTGFCRQPWTGRVRELAAAGVNVCLGTDSLASIHPPRRAKPELNMFAEMRAFAASFPDTAPEQIVRMATEGGARALGMQRRVGGIFHGSAADLIAIPFSGKVGEPWEAVVHHTGDVSASMIDGRWTHEKPKGQS